MAILSPTTWQTGSVGLQRAGDPDALSRVAGLECVLTAPNAAWPTLGVKGGVRNYGSLLVDEANPNPVTTGTAASVKTASVSTLGQISVPGDATPGAPTETSDWSFVKLAYSGEFDLTLSRATSAMLLETSATSLRLCGGTTTKRTTNGTTITETASQLILPKYVAYHTSGGYQVQALSGSSINLSTMDQPWLLVWWGSQSHWCDATIPMNYSHNQGQGWHTYPQRYAFQADCPLLLVFGTNPSSIVQTAGQGGFDLAFSAGAKKMSVFPLYGRSRQLASTTDGWNSGANLASGAKTLIQAIYPTMGYFPSSVAESYAYNSGTDTATITETVTWTTVNAAGTKLAPLPPVLGTARDTSLSISLSGSVTDLGVPTEYGPTQGIAAVDAYTWSVAGLATYAAPRAAPGGGLVPSDLRARLEEEVDKLTAHAHWSPWYFADRLPGSTHEGEPYWFDPADTLAQASELVPLVSGSRQATLKSWLTTERTNYTPESTYRVDGTVGTNRGPAGIPNDQGDGWFNWHAPSLFPTRRWLWCAWALARYYQEAGVSVPSGLTDTLLALLNADMAEHGWDTMHWLGRGGEKQSAVENANRHLAGLLGLLWISTQNAATTASDITTARCLLAKAVVARVAMAHLPRWQYAAGLITLPSDLGSAQANAEWLVRLTGNFEGFVWTSDWTDSSDDPRQVMYLDQFTAFLDDSNRRNSYADGVAKGHQIAYRSMVRPIASLLASACPGEGDIYVTKYRELHPHWSAPWTLAHLDQEHSSQHPKDSYGLFLSRAWLVGVDAATLEREAGYPWIEDGGDLFTAEKLAETMRVYADTGPVGNVSLSTDTPTLYGRVEWTFDVATAATQLLFPYDASAPAGQDGTLGVTVDLMVSRSSGFGSFETKPCFWWEDWTTNYAVKGGQDWFYPTGTGHWKARWRPEATGVWYWQIRVEDAGGETFTPVSSFTVSASAAKGPLVRSVDTRYLEYANGDPFHALGLNLNYERLSFNDPETVARPVLAACGANGIRIVRAWLPQFGVLGSAADAVWTSVRAANYIQSAWATAGTTSPTGYADDGDDRMAVRVDSFSLPFLGWLKYAPACKRSTTYRVRLRYMIPTTLTGPLSGAGSYGLCVKLSATFPASTVTVGGEAVWQPIDPTYGTVVGGTHLTAATAWTTATLGTFTTGSTQDRLTNVSIALDNVGGSGGAAFVSRIWIEEDLGGGTYGPNIVSRPSFDLYSTVDQRQAEIVDRIVQAAEDNDVQIQMVMLEKIDYFLNKLDATTGLPGPNSTVSEALFYGTSGSRSRWLHAAYARYAHGRWG